MDNGHKLFTKEVQLVSNLGGKVCILGGKSKIYTVKVYFHLLIEKVIQMILLIIHKSLIK